MNATVMTTGPGVIHCDCYRVEKLLLVEPMVLSHDSAVKKRHDGEAAAKDESPCSREVAGDSDEQAGRSRSMNTSKEPNRRNNGCSAPRAGDA